MGDAADTVVVEVLKGLVTAVPSFGSWLADLLDNESTPSAFSRRVRDILPERSASRDAAARLGGM